VRYFGLYFAFFCFAFSYIFKANATEAILFGLNMLFSYFVFTTAVSLSIALVLFLALKKGLSFASVSPFFGGLLKGAAGLFFATLLANRGALLLGSYLLILAMETADLYMSIIAIVFLALGYIIIRPFNFDFVRSAQRDGVYTDSGNYRNNTTIDVEVVDDFEKVEKK